MGMGMGMGMAAGSRTQQQLLRLPTRELAVAMGAAAGLGQECR